MHTSEQGMDSVAENEDFDEYNGSDISRQLCMAYNILVRNAKILASFEKEGINSLLKK